MKYIKELPSLEKETEPKTNRASEESLLVAVWFTQATEKQLSQIEFLSI